MSRFTVKGMPEGWKPTLRYSDLLANHGPKEPFVEVEPERPSPHEVLQGLGRAAHQGLPDEIAQARVQIPEGEQ